MIFTSGFDRRKVNPFAYITCKFWRQACLSSLLYGVELFTESEITETKMAPVVR